MQAVFVALSLTRMFLIFKVNKDQRRTLHCNTVTLFVRSEIFGQIFTPEKIFTQPTDFNQLDHERRFKFVFSGLFISTAIYALAALSLNNWLSEGQG